MSKDRIFYVCEHCGNLVEMVRNAGVPMICCGQKMTCLEPKTEDGGFEKHLPVVTVEGNSVRVVVGETRHPMTEEHQIMWVCLITDRGTQRKQLAVGDAPIVAFTTVNEKPLAVYAYCNLNGLWKAEIQESLVCPLKPLDTKSRENYPVCLCNNVSYFDILDAIHDNSKLDDLLQAFENVKNTTHCTTGCGGCYDKVIRVISDVMNGEGL